MNGLVSAILRSKASRPASCLFLVVFVAFIVTKVTYLVIFSKKKSRPKKFFSLLGNQTDSQVRTSDVVNFEAEDF